VVSPFIAAGRESQNSVLTTDRTQPMDGLAGYSPLLELSQKSVERATGQDKIFFSRSAATSFRPQV
jgi:hypothetical protein